MTDKVVQDPSVKWLSDAWIDELGKIPGDRCVEVIEIPFDYAVSHRPGARFGPAAIIEALNGFSLYCTDKRVDLSALRFKRSRTVSVSHDFPSTYSSIEQAAAALDHSTAPIFLGGDHSITDPILRGLLKHTSGRRVGLIVFDAHLGTR